MLTAIKQYLARWKGRFADNDVFHITAGDLRDFTSDTAFLLDRGPNDTVGSIKLVIYLTRAEAVRAGQPSYAALSDVKPESVILGNLACVNLYPGAPNTWLIAIFDDGQGPYPISPGFFGIADGSGQPNLAQNPTTEGMLSLKWVLKDSPEAQLANVPLYKAGLNYRENDLVRAMFGTFPNRKSVVFYSNESGNDIPAPSRPEGDAYWSVFNPAPPVTYPFQTVTAEELRQLRATAKFSANRLYVVSPRPIPGDPEDRNYPDVFVRALMETELEATAWLLIGTNDKQLVTYDLATDTTTPVASGGASSFAQLQGQPTDNPALAAALAAATGNGGGGTTLISRLSWGMAEPGVGNLAEANAMFIEDGLSGSYRLTAYSNVAAFKLVKRGPSPKYDGKVADYPAGGVMLEGGSFYDLLVTPADATKPVSLSLTLTV